MPKITKEGVIAQILMLEEKAKVYKDPEERKVAAAHLKVWKRYQAEHLVDS